LAETALTHLLEGCRRGQEPAMRAFYERFQGYALSVCLAYANDRDDALELVNDAFLKAFRTMKSLENEAALLPWFRKILVNTAIDHHRKALRRATRVPTEAEVERAEEPHWNEAAVYAQLSAEHILTELQRLAVPYRVVFSLYVLEGYAHAEIAQRLGIAESTSRAHLSEANRLLRRALQSYVNETHERRPR
jgi:RNA polymerase sigma-70 factor (ECF subfamily)